MINIVGCRSVAHLGTAIAVQIWNTNGVKPNRDLDKSLASFHCPALTLSFKDAAVLRHSLVNTFGSVLKAYVSCERRYI